MSLPPVSTGGTFPEAAPEQASMGSAEAQAAIQRRATLLYERTETFKMDSDSATKIDG